MKRAVKVAKRIHTRIYDGCRIIPLKLCPLLRAIRLPVHILDIEPIDGYLHREADFQFLLLNSRRPRTRQRFTVGHELGHYFLHPDLKTSLSLGSKKSQADRQADRFAEEFLMPEDRFRKFFEGFSFLNYQELVDYLALVFDVSRQAVRVRMDHLNLLNMPRRNKKCRI